MRKNNSGNKISNSGGWKYYPTAKLAFIFAMLLLSGAARSATAQETGSAPASSSKYEYSVSYGFSRIAIRQDTPSLSILNWAPIDSGEGRMKLSVPLKSEKFSRLEIGAGYGTSFYGYMTDDDLRNKEFRYFFHDLAARAINGNAALTLVDNKGSYFDHKLLYSFDALFITKTSASEIVRSEHDGDLQKISYNDYGNGKGINDTYNVFTFDVGYGLHREKAYKIVQTSFGLFGTIGISQAFADWKGRDSLRHPVSFTDTMVFFGAGTYGELGLKLGSATIFLNVNLSYKISPYTCLQIHYRSEPLPPGKFFAAAQAAFAEWPRAGAALGVKFQNGGGAAR